MKKTTKPTKTKTKRATKPKTKKTPKKATKPSASWAELKVYRERSEAQAEARALRSELTSLRGELRTILGELPKHHGLGPNELVLEAVGKLAAERDDLREQVKRWESNEVREASCCADNEERAEQAEQSVEMQQRVTERAYRERDEAVEQLAKAERAFKDALDHVAKERDDATRALKETEAAFDQSQRDLAKEIERSDEAAAEATACMEFLRALAGWTTFWDEGFLGEASRSASASTQNGAKLREFLDKTGHAKAMLDRLDKYEKELEQANDAVECMEAVQKMAEAEKLVVPPPPEHSGRWPAYGAVYRYRLAVEAKLAAATTDAYEKAQALAAVSTILLGRGAEVPAKWDTYGAVQDARAAAEKLAEKEPPTVTQCRRIGGCLKKNLRDPHAGCICDDPREHLRVYGRLNGKLVTDAEWNEAMGRTPPGELVAEPVPCAHCGRNPATCIGKYEDHLDEKKEQPSCSECCGHGNEDGYCKPIGPAAEGA